MMEAEHLKVAFQEALDETIEEYKALIADPTTEVKKWQDYGSTYACRLCIIALDYSDVTAINCSLCPLNRCPDDSMLELESMIENQVSAGLRRAAVRRLKWILNKAISNGYKVKEEDLAKV